MFVEAANRLMKEKPRSRLHVFLFSAAVFILTCVAYAGSLVYVFPPFLLMFIFIVAFFLLLAFASDVLMARFKWSAKKLLLLTLGVILTAAIVTQTVWTITTPSWSFSVATDKPTYSLGENVTITATLKNTGYISHSFKSKVSEPVLLLISQWWGYGDQISVWWTPFSTPEITEFSLSPGQVLQRSFTWNQTNIANPGFWNQTYMPGTYSVVAFIPDANADSIIPQYSYDVFFASTNINITQS